jgi:two-component system LytT family sensor kinase
VFKLLADEATAIVAVLVVMIGIFGLTYARGRRSFTSPAEKATYTALHTMGAAAPALRQGLSVESAAVAAPLLRELLDCRAVMINGEDGEYLTWDGESDHHAQGIIDQAAKVAESGQRSVLGGYDVDCGRPDCQIRGAVIVPLEVDGAVVGTLAALTSSATAARFGLVRAATEVARYVSTQLELAELDESRARLALAEVRALRAQISPHFIYNALNTIASTIRSDPDEARELLVEFAEFTRYSFRTASEYTTLADELLNVERYLNLERARFGDKLQVRLQVAPEVLPVVIPFLALQPLVENAVRHGLAGKPSGGTISVIAEDAGAECVISIEDDGVGMDPDKLKHEMAESHVSGAHVGLGNVHDRLRSAFGADYGLIVETERGAGMKVSLRVPKFRAGVRAPARR